MSQNTSSLSLRSSQSSQASQFRSVFEQSWDVVVFGSGYAGFAAARKLHESGKRVLLVGHEAAVLWESGWGFSTAVGASASPLWRELTGWMQAGRAGGAAASPLIDGATIEISATLAIQRLSMNVLYYAAPVAVWRNASGRLGAVAVATKSGIRVLVARAWVDATESGELLALLDRNWAAPTGESGRIAIYFRGVQFPAAQEAEISCKELPAAKLRFQATQWANERVLTIEMAGRLGTGRELWLPALRAVREQCSELADAIVTHGSVLPVMSYAGNAVCRPAVPKNVTIAAPGAGQSAVRTLADRFDLGIGAAAQAEAVLGAAGASDAPPANFGHDVVPQATMKAAVAVAGMGTGGALAAIAAGRAGADTLAFDPLPFGGGIGTGGGIHYYYFGVKGGLQEELDERVRGLMPLFGKTSQVSGFHPEAKKIVIDQMMSEAGVRVCYDMSIYAAGSANGRVVHADLTSATGPKRLVAEAWIDCTGDADLAALGGAQFAFGRRGDGQLHAYSQASGRAATKSVETQTLATMWGVNYDAGFVDPTDSEDLTRARMVGIAQLEQQAYTPIERPTYIAPALGLRQSRQIASDYMVTLADMLERRRFEDAVGMTGCHYDNHAIDYEFESDEAMFWVWCCRQWRGGRTASELPYRMMLPKGLSNVLVACRAAGISEEAHHSLRMQRDFQRLGEAAGYAAALMVSGEAPAETRRVPYAALRSKLEQTGALEAPVSGDGFGPASDTAYCPAASAEKQMAAWLGEVKAGFGPAMYHVMRRQNEARGETMSMLASADPLLSWRAATIVAMWEDAAAEARLLAAIQSREYGFENAPQNERPETNNRLAPHWLVAVALLRRCGTRACIDELCALASDVTLVHNARTAIAMTMASLAGRIEISAEERARISEALRKLLSGDVPNTAGNPQRKVTGDPAPAARRSDQWAPIVEDFRWQLHLAVAKAEQAAGMKVHDACWDFLGDKRAMVRRAFTRILQPF